MARRRKGQKINGIFLLDKPKGMTSQSALTRAKCLFDAQKAGHTGSLDPMATGVLPVLLGTATRVSSLLLNSDKSYTGIVQLGQATTTLDAEGEMMGSQAVPSNWAERLDAVAATFEGEILQIPPMVSALKHQGERLYALARAGKEVERSPRPVTIYRLRARPLSESSFELDVSCSKGTYIRSLAADMAQALGTLGYLSYLRRTRVAEFEIDQCRTLETLSLADAAQQRGWLIPIDAALGDYPAYRLDETQSRTVRQTGNPVNIDAPAGAYRVYSDNEQLLALGQCDQNGQLTPRPMLIDMPHSG